MSVRNIPALAASVRDRVAPTFGDFVEYESAAREESKALEDWFDEDGNTAYIDGTSTGRVDRVAY